MNLSKLFLISNFVTSQAFLKTSFIKFKSPPFNLPKPIQSNNDGLNSNGLGCDLVRTSNESNFCSSPIGNFNQASKINPDNVSFDKNYMSGPGQELVKQLNFFQCENNNKSQPQSSSHTAYTEFNSAITKTIKTKPK